MSDKREADKDKKLTPSTLKSALDSKTSTVMKPIKIIKTVLRALIAVPCALFLWVVYFTVGMFEALMENPV